MEFLVCDYLVGFLYTPLLKYKSAMCAFQKCLYAHFIFYMVGNDIYLHVKSITLYMFFLLLPCQVIKHSKDHG